MENIFKIKFIFFNFENVVVEILNFLLKYIKLNNSNNNRFSNLNNIS